MAHPHDTRLLEYVAERAPEEEGIEIAEHLADCPSCAESVRALIHLRENFASLWEAVSAESLGKLHRTWTVVRALCGAVEREPGLATRAKDWLQGVGQTLQARALVVLVDRAKRLGALAADVLPEGYRWERQPALAGYGAPDQALEAHLKQGSDLLSTGRVEAAIEELELAARTDPRRSQAAGIEVFREGRRELVALVDSQLGRVWVRLWPVEEDARPRWAILLPMRDPSACVVSALESVPGQDYLYAEFHDVPSGPFNLLW
jgi:hypothetical protein